MHYFAEVTTVPRLTLKREWWQFGVLIVLISWLYCPILLRLIAQWWTDPNFSHGFFVPAFSTMVLWRERARLSGMKTDPSAWGLPIVVFALGVLIAGVLGAELFLSRVSFLILIAGLILFFRGWTLFEGVFFPWAVLILMVPIPAIIFNHITFPLQIVASKLAASLLPSLGVPVLREGNVINLPTISLEVAEACSGIRSLLSLVTLAIVYGYFAENRKTFRIILAVASVPIAVGANSLRIVGTGLLGEYWGPDKAEGFFHTFSGWLIFMAAMSGLSLLHAFLHRWTTLRDTRQHAF